MRKISLLLLCTCCLISIMFAACGEGSSSTAAIEGNVVHMQGTSFVQKQITIKKGETLSLVADDLTPHVITNGMWEQDKAKKVKEPGAPAVNDLQINGNSSASIGPFTTAGIFQFYCTIHPGMNLTVVVK